nr:ribonuclease H-like domain, reverse transcriptase, RNA-dependent DNA polymerase [Tanacetum cinerariifolium]
MDKIRVNAASAPVTAIRTNLTNSTDNFNAASLSNNAVSPIFEIGGKSAFVDPSQYPDNPDMPALEDIVYSDDEEDVGADADFSYLETNISISPIPTTRVYKDHPISQIIGELNTAPQIRRFEDPDYPDKVYKVVKALYGLHQAPRAWQSHEQSKVGKETESTQEYVLLPLWSTGSKDPQNTDTDATFDVKENENEVYVSPSRRVKDLRDEFKEFSVNNTNRVNAASAPVTAIRTNLTNSTDNFNAASLSNNAVSPIFEIGGKSAFVDPSQYPDNPDMPALEDIVYS